MYNLIIIKGISYTKLAEYMYNIGIYIYVNGGMDLSGGMDWTDWFFLNTVK